MTDNVIPFKRREPEGPDDNCVWIDESGVVWYKFAYEYEHAGSQWGFELFALSMEDAVARLSAIGSTGKVSGQLYASIPAGDVDVNAIVRAGGVMCQNAVESDDPTPLDGDAKPD